MDITVDINKDIVWMKGWKGTPTAYLKLKTPSISTILDMVEDPEFDEWKKQIGEEQAKIIGKNAMDRGTAMHAFIENYYNDFKKTKDPTSALKHTLSMTPAILEKECISEGKINEGRSLFYKLYYSDEGRELLEIVKTELYIFDKQLFFRGKTDLVWKQPLYDICLTDYKSSSSYIKKGCVKEHKYKLQLGGYALGFENMANTTSNNNVNINYCSILAINTKTDLVQKIECMNEELGQYKEEFKTLVKQYHINNNQEFLIK